MWNQESKRNLTVFLKAGLPYTVAGVLIVFGGLYALKEVLAGSEYLTVILFLWLAVFWLIYQPLFRKRIRKVAEQLKQTK